MVGIAFWKMHGLGNDFVIIDSRGREPVVTPQLAATASDRRLGVGYDQLAEIQDSDSADAALVFFNADGSPSAACGNATRCIASRLMEESSLARLSLETGRGHLECRKMTDGRIGVNMGHPLFDWKDIPLSHAVDSLRLPMEGDPLAVSMGNPHCVFLVEDAEAVELARMGPQFEHHPLFPERTNVEYVSRLNDSAIRLRIWERGAGITPASGSGSCAATVAAVRRDLVRAPVDVHVDGGVLLVDWRDDGVWLTGPVAHVFDGVLNEEFVESSR